MRDQGTGVKRAWWGAVQTVCSEVNEVSQLTWIMLKGKLNMHLFSIEPKKHSTLENSFEFYVSCRNGCSDLSDKDWDMRVKLIQTMQI